MLLSLVALVGGIALVSITAPSAADPEPTSDSVKIAAFLREMDAMTPERLNALEPIAVRRFELPQAGVDVMRARLLETYSVDGVGTDTVELTGWIAVKHDNARPAKGEIDLTWRTAVVDTEFVAMDLTGHSDVFGPVHVTLDRSRPSRGQVGRIEIPELARAALAARLDTSERDNKNAPMALRGGRAKQPAQKQPAEEQPERKPQKPEQKTDTAPRGSTESTSEDATAVCSAPVIAAVSMPDLGLEMTTKDHVYWYSLVDTIPPVGHTASITVDPVRLISAGREVGTLESGIVTFREVVRHVPLSDNNQRLASKSR
jgi:hypothetical protein